MKTLLTSTLAALLCLAISTTSPAAAQATATTTAKKIPFYGKLQAVDTSAQSITIEGKTPRVFYLTPTTKITDGAGNPSTLSAATVGEDVGGSYTKDATGKMTLHSVRFGAKTGAGTSEKKSETTSAPAPAPEASSMAATAKPTPAVDTSKKYKFTGTVVSVGVGGGSIMVHGKTDETYAVTDSTKITDASGKKTTLAGFKAGAKVSGSYTKAADGTTFTASTLKLSK